MLGAEPDNSADGTERRLAPLDTRADTGEEADDLVQHDRVSRDVLHIAALVAQVRVQQLIIVGAAVAMMLALDTVVNRTKLGAGIRAVAQDSQTASLMGVNINRVISQTFVIGGLLGGAAGFLFGTYLNVHYQMGFLPGIKAFAAAVLGGIGNIRGAMLGGLLLGIVESVSQSCMSSQWIDVVAFVVLILVLMFRPTGILGQRLGRAA